MTEVAIPADDAAPSAPPPGPAAELPEGRAAAAPSVGPSEQQHCSLRTAFPWGGTRGFVGAGHPAD